MLEFSVRHFVEKTASKSSTPGGGSVAGVVAALAAALGEMSLNFTIGKKKFAEFAELHQQIADELHAIRTRFLELIEEDIVAYRTYCETAKLEDSPEKTQKLYDSLIESIEVPRTLAKTNIQLLNQLDKLKDNCNSWLISDLVAGARLAVAVSALCDLNVRINARTLEDNQLAASYREQSTADRKKAQELADHIENAVAHFMD